MQWIDISKRSIGVNFIEDGSVTITVWAPLAGKVEVEINEGTRISLNKSKYGYWNGADDKIKEGTRYKFKVDDNGSFPDPASLSQPDGVHGASEMLDVNSFQWSKTNWHNHSLEDYIIYELHTGTFTNEGTFAAIEEKLDHLKELGITAIELMPLAQFPGRRNWG